jgi:hypothetical protein
MVVLAENHKKYDTPRKETIPGWFLREEGLKTKT